MTTLLFCLCIMVYLTREQVSVLFFSHLVQWGSGQHSCVVCATRTASVHICKARETELVHKVHPAEQH